MYSMRMLWCEVQVCRGPNGERLPKSEWKPMGLGILSITHSTCNGKPCTQANLERLDVDRRYPVTWPIFDVRVMTYRDGLMVIGFQIASDSAKPPAREYRQAWYCVPVKVGSPGHVSHL
jgi:hypothetical protein